jgi:hypothetical protein
VKVVIEPTSAFVTLEGGAQGRIWEGATDAGVPVALVVAYVGCDADAELPELGAVARPSIRSLAMFAVGTELEIES